MLLLINFYTDTLNDVGYIHATSPNQTMDIIQRFKDFKDVVLLLIDLNKVSVAVQFEPAPSTQPGLFPPIYGPLNIDSVYKVEDLQTNLNDEFIAPNDLLHTTG